MEMGADQEQQFFEDTPSLAKGGVQAQEKEKVFGQNSRESDGKSSGVSDFRRFNFIGFCDYDY